MLEHLDIRGNGLQLIVSPGEFDPRTQVGDAVLLADRWVDCHVQGVSIFGAKPDEQATSGKQWEAQAGFAAVATTDCVWEDCYVESVFGDGWEFLGLGVDGQGRSLPNVRPVLHNCSSWGVGRNVVTTHATTQGRLTGVHQHRWFRNDLVHPEERKRADRYWVHNGGFKREFAAGSVNMGKRAMQRAGLVGR